MAVSGFLKQSTSVTVKIGPFVDSLDGNSEEGGLTIAQADVRLSKNSGNIIPKNEVTTCTHDELGLYDCPLDDTDTNTLGILSLIVHVAGALHVRHDYMIMPANVWDSMFSTDLLQVDLQQWIGTAPLALTSQLVQAQANSLGTQAKTDVNTEVADVIKVDTMPENAQGIPAATPTMEDAIMYLYMALRNAITVTNTSKNFTNDAGTILWKKAISDDGSTYTEAEGASGP